MTVPAAAAAVASPPYTPRALALALAHAAASVALVLLAGILPEDFAGPGRLAFVVVPTLCGGLAIGWLHAALLRAMSRRTTPWMAFFLAVAAPFATGVAAFLVLMVGSVFAFGGMPDDALMWTLFALPFAIATLPWHGLGVVVALGGLAFVLMRPLARAPEPPR